MDNLIIRNDLKNGSNLFVNKEYSDEGINLLVLSILKDSYKEYSNCLKEIKRIKKLKRFTIKQEKELKKLYKIKTENEEFYHSGLFVLYSRGLIDGDDVIKEIQRKCDFND